MAFKDVAHWMENGNTDHRPDITLYPTHPTARDAYEMPAVDIENSAASKKRKPYIARCAYPWMITAIEVKTPSAESGFGFKPREPLLRGLGKSVAARSQFATYAAEIMLRQHRKHLYMFYIAGWHARVFLWDRNGAVVSGSINLRQYSGLQVLLNLMYRLIVATPEQQGYDTTATLATKADITKLLSYKTDNVRLKQYHRLMVDNQGEYPIFKVRFTRVLMAPTHVPFVQVQCDEILQSDGPRQTRSSRRKRFLIGKHVAGGYTPIGRATRGWVAYSLDDGVMVFLKEQWRANCVGVNPEMETYERFRRHGVQGVATVIAGGDVAGHRTISQRYFNKGGFELSERIQTRLVLKEVGRPLETYRDSVELILLTTQAILSALFLHNPQPFVTPL